MKDSHIVGGSRQGDEEIPRSVLEKLRRLNENHRVEFEALRGRSGQERDSRIQAPTPRHIRSPHHGALRTDDHRDAAQAFTGLGIKTFEGEIHRLLHRAHESLVSVNAPAANHRLIAC